MEYSDVDHFASDEERAKALAELIAVEPPAGALGALGHRVDISDTCFSKIGRQ